MPKRPNRRPNRKPNPLTRGLPIRKRACAFALVQSNAARLARRIAKKGSLGANETELIAQAFALQACQVSAWAQQQTQPFEEDALAASLIQLGMNT